MKKLTIDPSSELSTEETAQLQATLEKIAEKVEKARALEQHALDYFKLLEQIGEELEGIEGFEEAIVGGDEIAFADGNYGASAAYTFDFWIPSSMGC